MTSNQRVVQVYLERHGIGQLFEDMMARLIKEMPNEPIPYLLKMLQKIYQKKSGTVDIIPSPTGFKSDMGLVGSSIPKKFSKDPQVVLPGSKPTVSTWASSDVESVSSSDDMKSGKQRGYEKPWLSGAKPPKTNKDKNGSKADISNWNSETKVSAKSFDDLFDQQNDPRKIPLSKSLPVGIQEPTKHKKGKDNSWSEQNHLSDKENKQPYQHSRMAADEDDELKVDTHTTKGKKITISPATYSRYKKQNSKKKSTEQKQKLQALLSHDDKRTNKASSQDESTDEDEVEVMESRTDLAGEGVNSKTSTGVKRSIHKTSCTSDIKVGVCSRCARMLGNDTPSTYVKSSNNVTESDFFKPNSKVTYEQINSDDDDFESVSQINNNKPYRPKWPTMSDSDGDEVENITSKLSLKESTSKTSSLKAVNFKSSAIETDKSDFFERNSPLRKKTKQLSGDFTSDNESDIVLPSSKKSPTHKRSTGRSPSKQAWNQQLPDTGSEADYLEDGKLDTNLKSRGWKQKQVFADDGTDVL